MLIFDKTSAVYVENTSLCDGSTAQTVSNLYCTIAMTELRTAYGYVLNDLPLFKVKAYNVRGWSEYSMPNDEYAYIQTEPA